MRRGRRRVASFHMMAGVNIAVGGFSRCITS